MSGCDAKKGNREEGRKKERIMLRKYSREEKRRDRRGHRAMVLEERERIK